MLRSDRTAWIILVLVAGMTFLAIFNVAATFRAQRAAERAAVREEEEKRARFHAEAEAIEYEAARRGEQPPQFQAEARFWDKPGARDSTYVGAWNAPRIVPPPSPLMLLATGQSDLVPNSYKVGLYGKLEWQGRGRVNQQLEHPLLLKASRFDLAFVILYLYPPLILAVSYNMISGERDARTLPMLLAQPISLRSLVIGKLICRAAFIFGPVIGFSLLGLLLSRTDLSGGNWIRLLWWIIAVLLYGCFWFALAALVNAFGKSSAATALALAVLWLAFLFIIPSIINFIATTAYPVPARIEYLNQVRAAEDKSRSDRKRLVADYLRAHPELAQYGWTIDNLGVGYPQVPEAMPEKIEAEEAIALLRPVIARYQRQLDGQQRVVNRLGISSPAILMQSVLYDLAGTGKAHHEHFLRQVNAFNEAWNDYFDFKPFHREMVNASDYEHFPRFIYQPEMTGAVVKRILMPLAALALLPLIIWWLAVRIFRRYPAIG